MTYLGNSINIAGKNRFLSSNLMYDTAEFFLGNNSDISNINSDIKELETNILTLKQGGKISDIELKPLPDEFSNDWDNIYQKWILLKTTLTNNILKESQTRSSMVVKVVASETSAPSSLSLSSSSSSPSSELEINNIIKTIKERRVTPLVNSSNVLVTKLGEHAKDSSQYSIFLQILFAVLNIGVITAFILYIIRKLLKPIFALTNATSQIKSGNLNVVVKSKVNGDELSFLSESFNSMVTAIKNYIKKQNQLTKQLEKANEELKYRDQLKDEFIQVAAHELKTPIQPILGLCELLRDRKTDIVKDEEILDVIIRNSKRLMKLAEDILNVARIESGSFFLKKERFDIGELISEIMNDIEEKIVENKKNIKLFFELYNGNNNNNKIIVEADKNRLSQVISNLLNNAIKFTDEGSITIIVGTKKINNNHSNKVIVSIKDTGTGIDSEILPKLFTKFATKSPIEGGTGLGLFISKSIIEMHGGSIWAFNNDEKNKDDRGSTFTFSLPVKE
ncbi:MAG: HAMP domain-containing sensor histidine kinase [Nitrososphaeraceae archaeon]|nr:HAMP domain-containing sensor histidine kinase [Nitrososphaeraceae archaeon]